MHDTIIAFSGGSLPAAVGVIRLSGPQSHGILAALFAPKAGIPITNWISQKLYYGTLSDLQGHAVDLCLACLFPAPHSYTGEAMAEIHCHGSAAVVAAALEHAYALGARPAKAGEFTQRAFLAGKLDLTEAEAVADLIEAASPMAAREAAAQLEGSVGGRVGAIRSSVAGLLAHFYAACDYTDEDIEPFEHSHALDVLATAIRDTDTLWQGFASGQLIKTGIPVAIVGRPNVGKSSLFNALAGHERAIVTEEAGTTRDVLDTVITLGGAPIRLLDTAGIRQATGRVEEIGIQRAQEALANSHACIIIIDCSIPATPQDAQVIRLAQRHPNRLLAFNKWDLGDIPAIKARLDELRALGLDNVIPQTRLTKNGDDLEPVDTHLMAYPAALRQQMEAMAREQGLELPPSTPQGGAVGFIMGTDAMAALEAELPPKPFEDLLPLSAKTGFGLDRLRAWLADLAPPQGDDPLIASARQAGLLQAAASDLRAARNALLAGMTPDAFLSDAERAVDRLGQVTGETASLDMAAEIFSRFCVGK